MQTARQARLFSKQCDGIGSGLTQWFGSPLGWLLAPATGALVFCLPPTRCLILSVAARFPPCQTTSP